MRGTALKLIIALICAIGALVMASGAQASVPITVHVTDQSGRDQVGVYVLIKSRDYQTGTDDYGLAHLNANPGETISVRRGGLGLKEIGCEPPPEGWGGVSRQIPTDINPGDVIEVTLPDIVTEADVNQPSSAERAFVGMLNDQREERGLARLRFSDRLNAAAERLARDLDRYRERTSCENSPHEEMLEADIGIENIFLYDGVFVNGGVYGSSAALSYFLERDKSEMMNRFVNAIGVAQVGSSWYMLVDVFSDDCDRPACELSDDTGDSSAGGGTHQTRPAVIRLRDARVRDGRLKLRFTLRRASGALSVETGSGKRMLVRGRGARKRASVKVHKFYRLSVRASADSRGSAPPAERCWQLKATKRSIKIKSERCGY